MWARRTPCRWPRSESHSFFALLGGCCPGTERRHRGLHQRNLWRLNAALGIGIASVDVEASPQAQAATRNLHAPPPFSPQPAPAGCRPRCLRSSFPGHLWQGDGARFPRAAVPRTGQCTACLKHRQSAEFPAARRRPAPRCPAAGREAPYRGPESVRPIGDRKFSIKMQTRQTRWGCGVRMPGPTTAEIGH